MKNSIATLYKRGRGNFLTWSIAVITEGTKVSIMITHGVVDMAESIEWQHNIKGANIGKVNEQSPYERAISLAESRAKTKKRSGYKDIEDLKNSTPEAINDYFNSGGLSIFLEQYLPKFNTDIDDNEIPMKCQQYFKSSKDFIDPTGKHWKDRKYYYIKNPYGEIPLNHITIKFPNVIQPKVNGVRAFAKLINNKVKLYSKKGLEYNLPHITEFLNINKTLFKVNDEDIILDGELYIPGEALGTITSAVNAMQLNTMRIEYHLFDIATDDMNQVERLKHLYSAENKLIIGLNSPIKLVRAIKVYDNAAVQKFTDEFIAEGYEGSIQREFDLMYKFGSRPMSITKLKRTISSEFRIINIVPQEKDDTLGMFVCTTGKEEFIVPAHGTIAFKQKVRLQPHNFIGKDLTIVFYEYTEKGIPFHIIESIVRDYE
jgi:hypothetical protein